MLPSTRALDSRAAVGVGPRRPLTVATAVIVGVCLYEAVADILNAELEEDLFPTVLSLVDRVHLPSLAAVPARHAGKAGMWAALGSGAAALQLAARRKGRR